MTTPPWLAPIVLAVLLLVHSFSALSVYPIGTVMLFALYSEKN